MIWKKRLVLLQILAILMAVLQYGTRAAGQEGERYSNSILSSIFYPYLTARYAVVASDVLSSSLHRCGLDLDMQSSFHESPSKWNSTIFNPPSRMPLARSCVDEWLAATGQMNQARSRAHWRQIYRRCYRTTQWRVFPKVLIMVLYTYGNRKVSYINEISIMSQ